MNKKLLFTVMSLAAFAACTNDDFESQQLVQESGSVQFEVINDEMTRAGMNGNTLVWNANDNDLYTLYHGATYNSEAAGAVNGYENATYKAIAGEAGKAATLSTPSVIKEGSAIMVWPVDTTFNIKSGDNLSIKIPAELSNIENFIPYVSDLVRVEAYSAYSESFPTAKPTAYKTAGKDRKYKVFMRPMASQLTIKADYNKSDEKLSQLYENGSACPEVGDGVNPITLTNVDLLTNATDAKKQFTTKIPLTFTWRTDADLARWNKAEKYNNWSHVTGVDRDNAITSVTKLSSTVLTGIDTCKFLILPQPVIAGGVEEGGVLVNTLYGRVVVAAPTTAYTSYNPAGTGAVSAYTADEYKDSWYRFMADPTKKETYETDVPTVKDEKNRTKVYSKVNEGMMQTINAFGTTTSSAGIAETEPVGAVTTRYVKVLLNHLDMTDLHIQDDKHLRDAARVWKHLDLPDVTVLLDGGKKGNATGEFKISQKTIEVINKINYDLRSKGKSFKVMPCAKFGEACDYIVITGGGNLQDIAFIEPNGAKIANVALNAGETWKWKAEDKNYKVSAFKNTLRVKETGVAKICNRGTFVSDATATILTHNPSTAKQNNILFSNEKGAKMNITSGTVNVQFNVTNYGEVTIASGAQYRQDGQVQDTKFDNEATSKPSRFIYKVKGNDDNIGKVYNSGVFATVAKSGFNADINNYGLIEHETEDAKTYITTNQTTGADFKEEFSSSNKMGRINLKWNNRMEDNVSVKGELAQGFVSVTIDGEVTGDLAAGDGIGDKINYLIIKSGPTSISKTATQLKYIEVNMTDKKEIAWANYSTTSLDGLIVLSDFNIKLNTTINATVTYLGADMYVGGTFNNATTDWDGYYGETGDNVKSKYITY